MSYIRKFVIALGVVGLAQMAPADLIAWWQGNGNALDSSGNGHDGSTDGGYQSGVFGQQAFSFNGSQNFSAPASPAWGLGSTFTINLWADFSSFSGAGPGSLSNTFIGQDAGGGSTNKWVFYYTTYTNGLTGTLGFHVNGSSFAFLQSNPAPTVLTGTWNMFTVSDQSDTLSFYMNASYLGSVTAPPAPYSATPLTIGESEGIGWFSGGIGDVQIYNTALSGGQINSLYQSNTTPEPPAILALGTGALFMLLRRRRRS